MFSQRISQVNEIHTIRQPGNREGTDPLQDLSQDELPWYIIKLENQAHNSGVTGHLYSTFVRCRVREETDILCPVEQISRGIQQEIRGTLLTEII
jgi:hypothetical protein